MLYETKVECAKNEIQEITGWVRESITNSGVKSGIAVISAPHTTSGISMTPYTTKDYDHQDIQIQFDNMIPTRIDYLHQNDTPSDASGHVKSAIMGSVLTVIVEDGKPVLGGSQGIFFFEFDGPRTQKCYMEVLSD